MNPLEAMDDDALLGPWFRGPSWDPWRAVLKGAWALPMTPKEREFFLSIAGREPPVRRVREFWVVGSRRAGKDSIASGIAATFAIMAQATGACDRLRPGERPVVMCLAVDREQARIVLNYIRGYFTEVPMLRAMVVGETKEGLQLNNGVDIAVLTNDFRHVRGRSILCAIFDEVAYWRSETSASPDLETYNAVKPGLVTIPGSMLIGISSPYRKDGLLHDKFKRHYGQDGDTLVIRAASRTLNPTLDQAIIDEALLADPAAARAEWLAEWRDDIFGFLSRDIIEACVDKGVIVRPADLGQRMTKYHAWCDHSGGVADSCALAIAHCERGIAILDCLVEVTAPFNPTSATKQIADVIRSYGLRTVTGDSYAGRWVETEFAKNGITYRRSRQDTSATYLECLPLFTSGRVRLLDSKKLVTQIASLERRTFASGRERIDHPAHSHDDCAASVAGVLAAAAASPRIVRAYSGRYSRWASTLPPSRIVEQIQRMTRH